MAEAKSGEESRRVLIVDDDPGIIKMLEGGLKSIGCTVSSAVDGCDGLKKARADLPDLMVLDVLLPDINGYDVIKQLKKDSLTKGIPVIMLTVKKLDEDKETGLALGADDYVTKPVHMGLFLKRVGNLLARG